MMLGWLFGKGKHKPSLPAQLPGNLARDDKRRDIEIQKAKLLELNRIMDHKGESFQKAADHITSLIQSDEFGSLKRKGADPHEYFRRP